MSNLVLAETIPMPEHSDDFSQLDEIELLKRLTMGSMGNVSLANIKRALDSDAGSVTNANIVRARDAIEMARLLTEKLAARRMEGRIVTDHPEAVRDFLVSRLGSARREELGCLYLDASFAVIRFESNPGSVAEVTCHPREIARRCIELDASSVALAHNHPSASLMFSQADVELTDGVRQALSTLGITLHDHYLIAGDQCLSIKDSMPDLFDVSNQSG